MKLFMATIDFFQLSLSLSVYLFFSHSLTLTRTQPPYKSFPMQLELPAIGVSKKWLDEL